MTIRNLEKMFRPKTIAVIGASAREGSLGNLVWRNLRLGHFKGNLYPVNAHGEDIEGVKIWSQVSDLPEAPDLAVILTPPDSVAGIVSDLGARGCAAGVVLTAGFGEGGQVTGRDRRDALLRAAQPYLFRIIGPNCLGIMVPGLGLNASFVRSPALPGRLALVTQSGAIASALLDWAKPRGIGFSQVVTLGDMCDVDFGDMLDYLCTDESTHAILLYVEGITHPRKFMSAARKAARIKPVLVVKGGRQKEGAQVASSHTGALAGSDAVYDAVFARAGIMRVEDLDDLFAGAELLAHGAPVTGERLAIVTNGGGLGVLAVDYLLSAQGRLADLSPTMLAQLDKDLPATWSHANPIDIIGDADDARYRKALSASLNDSDNDAVLVMYCPTAAADPEKVAQAVVESARSAPHKLVLAAWTGEESVLGARAYLEQNKIPTFATPHAAVNGFLQLTHYRNLQNLLMETPPASESVKAAVISEARDIISRVKAIGWLPIPEVKRLLAAYGIPCNRSAVAATPANARTIAQSWQKRVALKIHSPDIVHKSDVGGVVLDVEPNFVEIEATKMIAAVQSRAPNARIDGVTVEEMIKRPDAHELFIGMTNDPTFGPILAFGHGGTGVEIINDKVFGLPPLNLNLANAMIERTRVGKLLAGYRNRPAADTHAITRALVCLSQLVTDHPQIVDLDINPLLADEHGIVALDARIKIDPTIMDSRLIITPYPRLLERSLVTPAGRSIFVRPLQPQDASLLKDFGQHLSVTDLRFRFLAPLKEIDRRTAARLSQIDYDREMALIVTPAADTSEALAVARFHADPDNTEAEFAVAVRSDLQRQGIGAALMTYLIEIAAARGLKKLWGLVLSDNVRMLQLARALGMHQERSSQAGIERVVLDLPTLRK